MEGLPQGAVKFVEQHCIRCHNADDQEGDFRLDNLGISQTVAHAESWQLVMDAIQLGDMPPLEEPQPSLTEIEDMARWIDTELKRARSAFKGNTGEVVLRRLNASEYQNTVHDLFGIQEEVTSDFPEDARVHGFDNNGAALSLSVAQMQEYLNAAEFILGKSLVDIEAKPRTRSQTFSLHDMNERVWQNRKRQRERNESRIDQLTDEQRKRHEALKAEDGADPTSHFNHAVLDDGVLRRPGFDEDRELPGTIVVQNHFGGDVITGRYFRVTEPGVYRLSFKASGVNVENQYVDLLIQEHSFERGFVNITHERVRFDSDEVKEIVFEQFLLPGRNILLKLGETGMTHYARLDDGRRRYLSDTPQVAIYPMTMEGPIVEEWPPKGYKTLVGGYDLKSNAESNVKSIIRHAATNLFRRPVATSEINEFYQLYKYLTQKNDHAGALHNTFKALLVSPHFLYKVEFGTGVDEYALASRLSYFLWRTTPDAELLQLAAQGVLSQRQNLINQTERLLNDPRSDRFIEDFIGQWMKTYHVGVMTPDPLLYPEWDPQLREAMVMETHGFFRELIDKNLSLENIIDSDWTILNQRLAEHYGIEGVEGVEPRRVELDKSQTVRGGLLTQGTILNITSNGTTTSPIIRGVWLLDNFMGTPTPSPPPDVPVIEPDIRGATDIHDQLRLHREIPQCASCHNKIDPIGLALENFDVIGGWRDNYRALNGNRFARRGPTYEDAKPVEAQSTVPNMGSYSNFDEFRNIMKENEHLVYHNTAHKLATFALGRDLTFADNDSLDEMLKLTEGAGLGMRTLVHAMINNELFRQP